MVQGREEVSGYDWEDSSVPTEPEPIALPDHHRDPSAPQAPVGSSGDGVEESAPYGAPSFTYDPQPAPAPRRPALPAWAIVAIVVVQASALVASVALVLGGIERLVAGDPAPPGSPPTSQGGPSSAPPSSAPSTSAPQREPGTVTDSDGREITDGTGRYDHPATVGEHTVSWTAWTGGTLGVTALEVDLDASVPAAAGEDVLQDGYRLVLVSYRVRYDGPGQLAPAEELWLTGESDLTYFPDVAEGLVADPMKQIGPLQDGEAARFHSVFVVPEEEIDTFRLGVETFNGEVLYFGTP